jgi:hypothetical protein
MVDYSTLLIDRVWLVVFLDALVVLARSWNGAFVADLSRYRGGVFSWP